MQAACSPYVGQTPQFEAVVEARWGVHAIRTSDHGTIHVFVRRTPHLTFGRRLHPNSADLCRTCSRPFVCICAVRPKKQVRLLKKDLSTMSFPLREYMLLHFLSFFIHCCASCITHSRVAITFCDRGVFKTICGVSM